MNSESASDVVESSLTKTEDATINREASLDPARAGRHGKFGKLVL
jgi:hypothetical protein